MAPSPAKVARPAPGGQRQPASFRFPVTWACLGEPLVSSKIEERPARAPSTGVILATPAGASDSAAAAPAVANPLFTNPLPGNALLTNARANDSWEMVVPKMGRPGTRPARVAPSTEKIEPVKPILEIPSGPAMVDVPKLESAPDLGLRTLAGLAQGPGEGLSVGMKSAVAALLVLAVAGGVYLAGANRQQAAVVAPTVEVGPALPVGLNGWMADFAPPGGTQWGRRISVLRASQNLTDFRLEIPGQIDSKALGWVFRAKDSKNFYAMKLEIVKPIPQSTGVLTHFAVINGVEQPRVQVPLSMPLRPNTVYNIRMEALGSLFTTWIQDQKVDQWADSQIAEGGVGLYSEAGERSSLKGDVAVFPLALKSPARR